MNNYEWRSSLSESMNEYITIQKSSGFRFKQQEKDFQSFDHYFFYSGYQGNRVTKEMIDNFIYIKGVSPSTYRRKEILLHDFCVYLKNLGFHTYIPAIKTDVKYDRYIPHIYTGDELKRFFNAIDNYPDNKYPVRRLVDLVLFRVLYGTGIRISEALDLKVSNFDVDTSSLIILHSKNNRSRVVPLHPTLAKQMNDYIVEFHSKNNLDTPLFPSIHMTRLSSTAVYERFKNHLLMADIPRTGNGPRIHDFRHGFAVENLRRWTVEGKDLLNLIPYLSTYLGHVDYKSTQYYLRLTAEIYPDMMEMIENTCEDIIPDGGDCFEE